MHVSRSALAILLRARCGEPRLLAAVRGVDGIAGSPAASCCDFRLLRPGGKEYMQLLKMN
jgi:hypothetical protein